MSVGTRGMRPGPGGAALVLFAILAAELVLSVRQESQTWDEGCHIFAGYSYWTRADFGMNPEHPPLVKLLATVPLLNLSLRYPAVRDRYFKVEAFLAGREFLFNNDADQILFRSRLAAGLLTLLLAILVFLAANEMFGRGAAFVALVLVVFEPNLLAHGALVTTDVGLACFLFAAAYAYYRYVKKPGLSRLLVVGIAAGLVLATKHSGLLVLPILVLLVVAGVVREPNPTEPFGGLRRAPRALRLAASLAAITVVAFAVLWSFYGFRFAARPGGQAMNPPLATYVDELHRPLEARTLSRLARLRLLPEAYLYGLADVRNVSDTSPSYIFGTVYRRGQWFYFPAAFAIKSTLAFLLLLLLVPMAVALRAFNLWREILFLTIPPAVHFLQAMTSGLNIGLRHILPIYPFLIVLAAGAAAALMKRDRRLIYLLAPLLLWHAVTSLRVFPDYLAYSNEAWGGPAYTYKLLTDSNVDWGQQLKAARGYLEKRGVKDCWFAYFVETVVDRDYYGIPCKSLPTISSLWLQGRMDVPPSIDGPVLISASVLSGYEFGPGELNPYVQFQQLRPTTTIGRGIFVYDGHFDIPLASAMAHASTASRLAGEGHFDQALVEAQKAVVLAPNYVRAQDVLGNVLTRLNRPEEARQAFQRGVTAAQTIHPEYQGYWVPILREKIQSW